MKVLEFVLKSQLAPVGGPLGYTYALSKTDNSQYLFFLEGGDADKKAPAKTKHRINRMVATILKYLRFLKSVLIGSRDEAVENNSYDIIHFHSTFDLYRYRKSIKKYHGITILTSHSPTLASNELFASATFLEKVLFWPILLLMRFADKRAFKIPDYIVFPCEYAEEPYIHSWRGFLSLKRKHPSKFKYLITGTYRRFPTTSREEIRNRYNIPLSAKIVCFVGRHNKIKGYDILKQIALKMLSQNSDIYFLIVGNEGPVKRLINDRWIEAGWTNDPHSIIAASDIFVLPNRETYFDLIFLETLSLGQLIVASETGGNKYFKLFSKKGIQEFSTPNEAIEKIDSFLLMSAEEQAALRRENLRLFEEHFNNVVFYNNYIELLRSLLLAKEK